MFPPLNLWAVLSLAIILALGWGLDLAFPVLFDGPYQNFTAGLLLLVVGGIHEMLGIRGRVLHLPVWLIGVAIIARAAYVFWGWSGIVIPVMAVGFSFWWIIRAKEKRELKRMPYLAMALSELQLRGPDVDEPAFWKMVENSLFLPEMATYSPEMRIHDQKVIQMAVDRLSTQAPSEQCLVWLSLLLFLKDHDPTVKPVTVSYQTRNKVRDFIAAKRKDPMISVRSRTALQ